MGKDDVAAFINTVECTLVISVNTEGTGFKIYENGNVGSGDRRVLFFNTYEIVPPHPRSSRFARTPEYTKIGSELEEKETNFCRRMPRSRSETGWRSA